MRSRIVFLLIFFAFSFWACEDQTQLIRKDFPLQIELRTAFNDTFSIAFDRHLRTLQLINYEIPVLEAYREGDRINSVTIEEVRFVFRSMSGVETYNADISVLLGPNPNSFFTLASGGVTDLRREVIYRRQVPLPLFIPENEESAVPHELLADYLKNRSPFFLRLGVIYSDSVPEQTQVALILKGKVNVNAFEFEIEEEEEDIED